ncbi:hypothetical protein ACWDUM_00735 [Rhodococcus sp. NPDC003322]
MSRGDGLGRYRVHRAVDPGPLHADAEVFRSTAAVMRAHLLAQEQAVARLAAGWAGEAADAALAALGRRLDRARADCAAVAAAAETLDGAADLIRDALAAQADFVVRLGSAAGDGPDAGPDPGGVDSAVAPCVRARSSALTDLFAVIHLVVDGARTVVEEALDAVGGEVEPAADEWPETPASGPREVAVPHECAAPLEAAAPQEAAAPRESDVPKEEPGVQQDSVLRGLVDPPAPPARADVADPPIPPPVDVPGALGFGSGAVPQRDRPRVAVPPADLPGDSATGAELAAAGQL